MCQSNFLYRGLDGQPTRLHPARKAIRVNQEAGMSGLHIFFFFAIRGQQQGHSAAALLVQVLLCRSASSPNVWGLLPNLT